ncbi:MAG: ATP-binding protein, partial [Cyanobacteria bacterium P01_E01_bin.34]
MSIRPLPQTTVDLMVAGEAIDSLAAAVRELMENSLDAGASRISVQVWPERWTVKVTDDGCGITASELERASLPYCTSKLGQGLLDGVNTLGFRG